MNFLKLNFIARILNFINQI